MPGCCATSSRQNASNRSSKPSASPNSTDGGSSGSALAVTASRSSNAVPEITRKIYDLTRAGHIDEAMRWQYRILELFDTPEAVPDEAPFDVQGPAGHWRITVQDFYAFDPTTEQGHELHGPWVLEFDVPERP